MFSTLKPGNIVHILEQTDKLAYKTGKIISIVPNYTGVLDIKVRVNDQEYEFTQLPYSQSVAKNGSIVIGETKDHIITELKKLKEESESIIDPNNIKYHESRAKDATDLLRQMNPIYDKEIRRDEEIDVLKQQMASMASSIANIEKLLQNKTE